MGGNMNRDEITTKRQHHIKRDFNPEYHKDEKTRTRQKPSTYHTYTDVDVCGCNWPP